MKKLFYLFLFCFLVSCTERERKLVVENTSFKDVELRVKLDESEIYKGKLEVLRVAESPRLISLNPIRGDSSMFEVWVNNEEVFSGRLKNEADSILTLSIFEPEGSESYSSVFSYVSQDYYNTYYSKAKHIE